MILRTGVSRFWWVRYVMLVLNMSPKRLQTFTNSRQANYQIDMNSLSVTQWHELLVVLHPNHHPLLPLPGELRVKGGSPIVWL